MTVGKQTKQILNLASGEAIKLLDLAQQCRDFSNSDVPIQCQQHKKYEVDSFIGDPSQAKKEINWEPKISFFTGLQDYIKQCKQGV